MKAIKKHLFLNLRLLRIAWREEKWLLFWYFFSSFLGAVFIFIVYYFYKLMIDQVFSSLKNGASSFIFFTVITYLLSEYLSRFVYYTVNSYYLEYLLRSKFQNILTRNFMNKLADLDFANLEDGTVRNLIAKIKDTYTWRLHANLSLISSLVYSFSALSLSFIIAWNFNINYFLILAIFSIPLYYFRAKYGNAYWSIYSSRAPDTNYLWYLRYLFTNFQTLAEIKIYQLKDFFIEKTKQVQDQLIKDYSTPIKKYTFLSIFTTAFIPAVIYFVLQDFVFQIFLKNYSLGDFTFFLNTLFTFSGQISNIFLNFGNLYENDLFVADYFKFLNLKNKIKILEKPKLILTKEKAFSLIKFNNVSFSYPNSEKIVLKNINLQIKKGENIALVGKNGVGKTTLVKLLLRFYDPTSGQILIDGVDLKEIDLSWWWGQIGILFQDFAKYYLTIRENIIFGSLGKDDNKEIIEALKKARGEELMKFKKGLDQILGRWFEEGEEISIGQWQKIAIARALYRGAPLLILDEPTSNIDPQAEEEIFENLINIYRQKTLFFISHRFSTVRNADKIVVLDQGEIVEEGSHEKLIKNNHLYKKLFQIQKRGYE